MSEEMEAKEAFVQEYMFGEPYSKYINMVGLTQRFIAEWEIIRERAGAGVPEGIKEELRSAGENPDEWCIVVGLRKPLPNNLTIPEVYKGFKVFVKVIGEIRPL